MSIAVLMAFSGASLGAHANTTYLAPYVGTKSTAGSSTSAYCGSAGGAAAKWKASTGGVTGASTASFKSCPYLGSFASAESTHYETVMVPISLPFQAEYNASTTFTWKLDPSMHLTRGACPAAINYSSGYDYNACLWESEWWAIVSVEIYDRSTQSVVSPVSSYWYASNFTEGYVDNDCYLGNCTTSSGTYAESSAYDATYQAPGYDESYLYLSNGPTSGSQTLWTNSSSWDSTTGTGSNYTMLLSDGYAVVLSITFGAYAAEYGYDSYYTGVTSGTIYFNPAGSGSGSVSALPTHYGLTVTSVSYNAV